MGKIHYVRIAIIDLGTNSVRFDVHQIGHRRGKKQYHRLLHREKLMVRLGENVFLRGKLDPKASRRTLEAFLSFRKTAADLKVDKTVAFATSALREAADAEDLIRAIRQACGIEVKIISGDEEARLIASGILAHQRSAKGSFALVDIGGGSTEISICENGKIHYSESFPLGAARLQQVFLKEAPPPRESSDGTYGIQPLRRHIQEMLLARMAEGTWPQPTRILGSSGTIKALGRLAKKSTGKPYISKISLQKHIKLMSKMTVEELGQIPGLEPKRVDLILAGAILLDECMEALEVKRVYPTLYSLRDGILNEEMNLLSAPRTSSTKLDLAPLYARACQFGGNLRQLKRMVETAEVLFDRLRALHNLDPQWRRLLIYAVIFRDTGRAISPLHHEIHSHYIVMNSELPVTAEWETEFVAELCLRHEGGKLDLGELPFAGDKYEPQRKAFPKLLALLRIIDALDPAHHQILSGHQIRVRPEKVQLKLSRGHWVELAVLRLQQKKALFEKVFERPLSAESV